MRDVDSYEWLERMIQRKLVYDLSNKKISSHKYKKISRSIRVLLNPLVSKEINDKLNGDNT